MKRPASVREYYERTIGELLPNNEGLFDPVHTACEPLFKSKKGKKKVVVDLGYGFGNYTISAAVQGCLVHAVDFISSRHLRSRITGTPYQKRIRISTQDIAAFVPQAMYDVVVAVNVLHFLRRRSLRSLLHRIRSSTANGGVHFVTFFCDIERFSDQGRRIRIAGEASYSSAEFLALIRSVYAGWDVQIHKTNYREADRSGEKGKYYFKAVKIAIIARHT